jgi:hypothetical protein
MTDLHKRIKHAIIPEGYTSIGDIAFIDCKRLIDIKLPESLADIGILAFENCPNLETVTLSRKTRIGLEALDGFTGRLVYRD